jgi:DNA ligase-1
MSLNSQEVYALLWDVAKTSSRLDKERMLREHASDPLLKRIVQYAYDPFYVYGIEQIPNFEWNPEGEVFTEGTFQFLDDLRYRRVTGNDARDQLESTLALAQGSSAELLTWIIKKDLRGGFAESTINKVWPGLLPEFPYMRCSLPDKSNMDKWDWLAGVISQEKADGMFANCKVTGVPDIAFFSRQGTPFPLDEFKDLLEVIGRSLVCGNQYHGELLVYKDGAPLPREQSNGQLNRVAQGGKLDPDCSLVYAVWDAIPLHEVKAKGKYDVPYAKRLAELVAMVKRAGDNSPLKVIDTKVVRSKAEAFAHYRELLKKGKEGTIVKARNAIWRDGTSKDQVKLKLEVDVELEVTDFIEGEGKYEGSLGALVCKSACGQLEVNVNGRTDAMRDEVWSNKLDWLGAIVTVRANSIMTPSEEGKAHSLFLPRFIEQRKDKSTADTNAVEAA